MFKVCKLCTFALIVITAGAQAEDAGVNVRANILAPACSVSVGSANQKIDLGKGRTTDLIKAGDATKWTLFSVNFEACPQSVTNVTATLSGAPATDAPEYYLNTGSSNNVAIEVTDEAGTQVLSNGKTLSTGVDANHKATLAFKSRMITPKGNATSGSVIGVLQLTYTFK
ncbi:hypothetical protein MUU49_14635 [Scandinavium goeteborgense]|uniref:fimbrial protein n=1 Tax=Scandinavium goeteborgense TaxID=1851514 RepID=UPI002166704C|nr:fimbrial protein [Scandinavium goeteborgense]MCS2153792.1 hypothetical protein [Scandinavium goeteborgense]